VGKKGFAIRRRSACTVPASCNDIYERPDFYFARREIARTDQEIRKFRGRSTTSIRPEALSKSGHWFENEQQCRATFPCPFIPICYGPGADAVCDGKTTPQGFKRIFVDLTVKINEERDWRSDGRRGRPTSSRTSAGASTS
jgi:hypothetical protein